ncbi:MAG: DUF934 domain-containing protein [Alphaproteobacteria bacterium]|nr:DUF934 domain-containing protein [Alphaproteobacteria bacterium]
MSLIKDGRIVADPWRHVDDEAPLPATGGIIVSLARWQAERSALIARRAPLGVRLSSADRAEDIAGDLDRFDVIALEFPAFKDGRAYSTARLLRQRYQYAGELRAVGEVLRDQLPLMARCGFDAFEYVGKTAAEEALEAFAEIDVVYQAAADRRPHAAALRAGRPSSPQT